MNASREKARAFCEAQKDAIAEALVADDKATISQDALAKAVGKGFNAESIRSAAAENRLPFGFPERKSLNAQMHIKIPKCKVFDYFEL